MSGPSRSALVRLLVGGVVLGVWVLYWALAVGSPLVALAPVPLVVGYAFRRLVSAGQTRRAGVAAVGLSLGLLFVYGLLNFDLLVMLLSVVLLVGLVVGLLVRAARAR